MTMFGLFKKREKKEPAKVYLFFKDFEYMGFKFYVWADKDDIEQDDFTFYFKTGYCIEGLRSIYNTGVCVKNLNSNLSHHIRCAKEYIDKKINEPNLVAEALNAVQNINLYES